jgi:hypothetical protein
MRLTRAQTITEAVPTLRPISRPGVDPGSLREPEPCSACLGAGELGAKRTCAGIFARCGSHLNLSFAQCSGA